MKADLALVTEVNDAVEGAVIEKIEAGEGGFHIFLKDGRFLLFPDALVVAVCHCEPRNIH